MTRRKIQYWVIPPDASGEFVAAMENVLDTYARPYDRRFPVLTMDEQPVQLLKETRQPIPATTAHSRRLDYRYTPKHGSWLNVAENELSSLHRQCLRDRRFGLIEDIRRETAAWARASNAKQRGVDWQFRTADARTKLKSLYPNTQN